MTSWFVSCKSRYVTCHKGSMIQKFICASGPFSWSSGTSKTLGTIIPDVLWCILDLIWSNTGGGGMVTYHKGSMGHKFIWALEPFLLSLETSKTLGTTFSDVYCGVWGKGMAVNEKNTATFLMAVWCSSGVFSDWERSYWWLEWRSDLFHVSQGRWHVIRWNELWAAKA